MEYDNYVGIVVLWFKRGPVSHRGVLRPLRLGLAPREYCFSTPLLEKNLGDKDPEGDAPGE